MGSGRLRLELLHLGGGGEEVEDDRLRAGHHRSAFQPSQLIIEPRLRSFHLGPVVGSILSIRVNRHWTGVRYGVHFPSNSGPA